MKSGDSLFKSLRSLRLGGNLLVGSEGKNLIFYREGQSTRSF
jgi:hypothetical protein